MKLKKKSLKSLSESGLVGSKTKLIAGGRGTDTISGWGCKPPPPPPVTTTMGC